MLHLLLGISLVWLGRELPFEVRQVASDVVYLEVTGTLLPEPGDQLHIRSGATTTATLEVVSRSSRFVSCRVLSADKPVAVGDIAYFQETDEPDPQASQPAPSQPSPTTSTAAANRPTPTSPAPQPRPRKRPLRGTAGLQIHQFSAAEDQDSYLQPTLRLNLRAEELANGSVGFQLRTRSRYYDPNDSLDPRASDQETRIYKASVRIGKDDSRFQYHLGRLVATHFSGVGYFDGASGRVRLGERSQVGIFAGVQPDWTRPEGSETLDKYGAFYTYTSAQGGAQSTVAVAGEYQAGEINREYLILNNRLERGRFSLYQSAEVDFNRDWRSERGASSLDLSNLFLQGAYRVNERYSWSLGYDNRQNYYTWDIHNQDEALFDKLTRQGWRVGFNARLLTSLRLNLGAGTHSRDGEDDTQTWFINLYEPNLFQGGWSLRGRVYGFSNPYTEGLSPALHLGKRWQNGHQLWLGYSSYAYDTLLTGEQRDNGYLRLEGSLNLGRRWFLNGQLEHNTGDDAEGQHLYIDVGLRL